MVSWEIEGHELVNCNCSYGCPCQFNALPTHGFCEAIGAFAIERGHHGDVTLDGLKAAMVIHWPGAVHQGGGKCQLIVDAEADERQREAILRIMSGQDTEPLSTVFAVFATTVDKVFDPIIAPKRLVASMAAIVGGSVSSEQGDKPMNARPVRLSELRRQTERAGETDLIRPFTFSVV